EYNLAPRISGASSLDSPGYAVIGSRCIEPPLGGHLAPQLNHYDAIRWHRPDLQSEHTNKNNNKNNHLRHLKNPYT
ncbi:hypothetical protein, partial [Aeromonas sp. HMWF017]|uniref:hypothetical protein n=1 Tax=Aeromonas sp. HMWF017 TaxID=2056853 RepID=UPI001C6355A1